MSDAWGGSWGTAWAASWGTTTAVGGGTYDPRYDVLVAGPAEKRRDFRDDEELLILLAAADALD